MEQRTCWNLAEPGFKIHTRIEKVGPKKSMETVNNELVKGEIDNVGFSYDEGKRSGFVKP